MLGAFLAVADGLQAAIGHAAVRQVFPDRVGSTLPQREVVLGSADIARVALDLDAQGRIILQRCHDLVENPGGSGPQGEPIEVEVDILENVLARWFRWWTHLDRHRVGRRAALAVVYGDGRRNRAFLVGGSPAGCRPVSVLQSARGSGPSVLEAIAVRVLSVGA